MHISSPVRSEPFGISRSHSSGDVRVPSSPSSPPKSDKRMFMRAKGASNPTSPANRLIDMLVPFEEMRSGRSLELMDQGSEGYYRLGVELAQGAEGDVFAAVSACGGYYTQVAAKRIRVAGASHRRTVLNEVGAALLCRKDGGHANVIRHLDWFPGFGGADREVYIITERCDFGLDDLIRTVREARNTYERMQRQKGISVSSTAYRFAEAEVSKLLKEMTMALEFLNNLGIVHQDIKAENILWKRSFDTQGAYKICDFGVVGFTDAGSDGRFSVPSCKGKPGTLWTQAPEVLRSKHRDASCDVWSLGCVLFEVTYLEKPFTSIELMAYSNDNSTTLPDPFPPVRARKIEAAETPTRSKIRARSLSGFSPKGKASRIQQRWIYSSALKSLIGRCLTVASRPIPKELPETDEYAATLAVSTAPCKTSMTSAKFYQALLAHYKERPGSVLTLIDEEHDTEAL